jgi:ABC-2 type transport system ATP-binding protein
MPDLLHLESLTRTFGARTALDAISLRLPPGRVGLLGQNGAGKSTLLKLMMGLLPPTSGAGWVLGMPLGGDANWQLRRMVGFMPEADALVPGMTGVEYVALAGELYGMGRKQALRRGHEVLTYLELEEARYRKVEEYSAGMKQRAKLAQALVHDPPVLLLDEPTSGLDPAGRDAMLRLILELGREHGKSVILSTHLLADVRTVCERVVILNAGKLVGVGTTDELCARRDDRFKLTVSGDAAAFRRVLTDSGVAVTGEESDLRVRVPAGWESGRFFALAGTSGAAVRSLTRDDETLEELFLKSVTETPLAQEVRP